MDESRDEIKYPTKRKRNANLSLHNSTLDTFCCLCRACAQRRASRFAGPSGAGDCLGSPPGTQNPSDGTSTTAGM